MLRFLMIALWSGVLAMVLSACNGASKQAPDFTLVDAQGGDVTLSDYRGTPVFLFFHMAGG